MTALASVPENAPLAAADVAALADRLHRAERDRRPIARLTDERQNLTEADAYRIQAALVERRVAEGETVCGAKLGFTSRAMQQALGVDHPNFGWLTDAMVADDGVVRADELIHPKVEPEIAFLIGRDLAGPGVTAAHVLAATDAVVACLEVVDSRYEGFRFMAQDNIADDSSSARFVLGRDVRRPHDGLDLALTGVVLVHDEAIVQTAAGAAVLGHPAVAVAWLVRRLAGDGRGLRAGDVVLSGGLTAPVDLRPGHVVTAEIAHLGRASVRMLA